MPKAKVLSALPIAFALSLSAAALGGCDSEGPAEQAGETVDEAAKDTGRAVKDATD